MRRRVPLRAVLGLFRRARSLAGRLPCRLFDALIDFGRLWVHVPEVAEQPLAGPVAGHPERLCPDVPLTDTEQRMMADLLRRRR